jgi:hypothetical protein
MFSAVSEMNRTRAYVKTSRRCYSEPQRGEEDIHIMGKQLGHHKRPKDHTAGQMACGPRHMIDAFESQTDQPTLG